MILQDHPILIKYFDELNLVELLKKNSLTNLKSQECFNKEFVDYSFDINGPNALYIANIVSDSFYGYCRSVKDEQGYHLGCSLPIEGDFFNEEYDRFTDAIELYSIVYKENISETGIASNDLKKGIRSFEFQDKKLIKVGGDIDFNFKMSHVRYFQDVVVNGNSEMTTEEKKNLSNLILRYNNLTYTPRNISLLPVTGGLNNIKKSLGNDRLDTFLFTLKLYYDKGYSSLILSASAGSNPPFIKNRNMLKEFLDSFGNIYNYCEKMYHIRDKDFVDMLCASGSKPIDTAERVKDYLGIADRVWFNKEEFYKEADENIRTQYQKMMMEAIESRGKKYINSFTGSDDYIC
jgi:hypothetical protein